MVERKLFHAAVAGRALFGGAARRRSSLASRKTPSHEYDEFASRRGAQMFRRARYQRERYRLRRMSCRRCSRRWACDRRGSPKGRSGRSWRGACANTTPTPTARCHSTSSSVCTTRSWKFPRMIDEVRARRFRPLATRSAFVLAVEAAIGTSAFPSSTDRSPVPHPLTSARQRRRPAAALTRAAFPRRRSRTAPPSAIRLRAASPPT